MGGTGHNNNFLSLVYILFRLSKVLLFLTAHFEGLFLRSLSCT